MKLWTAEEAEVIDERVKRQEAASRRRKSDEIPRCRCGCGREAQWPHKDGEPLFYSRKCGYEMAVRAIRQQDEAAS
jgi:hypothetical protein